MSNLEDLLNSLNGFSTSLPVIFLLIPVIFICSREEAFISDVHLKYLVTSVACLSPLFMVSSIKRVSGFSVTQFINLSLMVSVCWSCFLILRCKKCSPVLSVVLTLTFRFLIYLDFFIR